MVVLIQAGNTESHGADSYNVTEGDGAFNLGVTAEDKCKSSHTQVIMRCSESG